MNSEAPHLFAEQIITLFPTEEYAIKEDWICIDHIIKTSEKLKNGQKRTKRTVNKKPWKTMKAFQGNDPDEN